MGREEVEEAQVLGIKVRAIWSRWSGRIGSDRDLVVDIVAELLRRHADLPLLVNWAKAASGP